MEQQLAFLCPTCRQPMPEGAEIPVGLRLRAIRKSRGLSVTELAARMGVTHPYICNVELGVKQISYQAFITAARVLGVSLDELAGFTPEVPA